MIDYQKIASNYNIKVHKIELGDESCIGNGTEIYLNRSFCGGKDEIWIGIYDVKDEEIASFFHELGHCISSELGKYEISKDLQNGSFNAELDAWMVGLIEAYKYGYLLPRSCFDFMINCIKSYDKVVVNQINNGDVYYIGQTINGVSKFLWLNNTWYYFEERMSTMYQYDQRDLTNLILENAFEEVTFIKNIFEQ